MMSWLLFADELPQHITQIGLGGGSFARWLHHYLPDCRQTAVEINPQVIQIARASFCLDFEGDAFQIIEADGAEYIQILRGNTDVVLVDGFDGVQIIDELVAEPFFHDCRMALSEKGIFAANAIRCSCNGCARFSTTAFWKCRPPPTAMWRCWPFAANPK